MSVSVFILIVGTLLFRPALGSVLCSPVSFTIQAASDNVKFSNPPDPQNETAVLDFLATGFSSPTGPATNGTVGVGGTFDINGIFCSPPPGHARNTLQILVHGSMYNKSYWTGFDSSDTYNWPLFATGQGYHTLAIDELGHGESRIHPDALERLQIGLHVEIMHELISSVRQKPATLGRSFNKIVWVGHSYGSSIAVKLVGKYPEDIDMLVATGICSSMYGPGFAPLFANITSARNVFPRFADLPWGYVTVAAGSVREAGMYAGNYDPAIARMDWELSDVASLGEALVGSLTPPPLEPTLGFTSRVLVVAGDQDAGICNPLREETCEEVLRATVLLFPDSRRYDFYAVPNTGHVLNLHYSAPVAADVVHTWLNDC